MALTLLEAAKLNPGEVYRNAVIEQFAASSDIMAAIPFIDIPGNAYKYNREEVLPGIAFRGVNESFTPSTGVINPQVEALVIAGGELDVDTYIVQTMGMNQRSSQEAMKIKSLAATWTTKFLKGDSASEPREFDGLQTRLTGNQVISAGTTANGAALSLAKLDELLDAVSGATHLIMNRTIARRLAAAARTTSVGGYVQFDVNSFGKRVMSYAGVPILVGYEASNNDAILPFTEAASSGTATASSVYAVNFGEEGVVGLQSGGMQVTDLGELQASPVYRTRVQWFTSIAAQNSRAAARLQHVGDLAIVA